MGKRAAQSTIIRRSSEAQVYNGGVRYGIIADDLAGGCDVAGRLTLLGYRPVVHVSPVSGNRSLSSLPQGAVVIVNTRSRDGSLREAVARARAAARLLERSGAPVTYQKMDSTLRGHWAEEMKSIAQVLRPEHILLCPAFPAQGRFVRDGHLRVSSGPYPDCSAFFEIREDLSLHARLQQRCGWEALEIPRRVIRRGYGAIRAAVRAPAVATAARCGYNVQGPLPPDTVFYRAARNEFDLVVAMYHDQGHIAAKTLGFAEAVNVTAGLPIIRTSVDHGTAFDLVGRNKADPRNMKHAILLAGQMARRQRVA